MEDDLTAAIDRDPDPLARLLCTQALLREKARRQIEREHADVPKSERVRMQNTRDLWCAIEMLMAINDHLSTAHPIVTRGTTRVLSRVINALYDVSIGAKPAFFDVDTQPLYHSAGAKPTGSTMAAGAEGAAAVVAELLISAMSERAATEWLDREIVRAGLVDREGNPVTARRIFEGRTNFQRHRGAASGRRMFEIGKQRHRALLHQPKGELKMRKVEEAARTLLYHLATAMAGEIAIPQRRTKSLKRRGPKKG